MELIFKFDGTLVNNPVTWMDTNIGLEYDSVNQILTINHDVQHTWVEDGYNYLYDKWLANDYCNLVNVTIEINQDNGLTTLYKGVISVTECVFNERKRSVQVTIKDNSFGSKIENNKGVDVGLDSTLTKNGEAISATPAFVFMFDSSTGTYLSDSCRGYSVNEAFEFLIGWMTDNEVSYQSDFFTTGAGQYDWIVSGIDLRNAGDSIKAPVINFQEFFDAMRKIRNIQMGFEFDADGNPSVRIEDRAYFISNTDTILLDEVNETELSFDTSILFTSVRVGSDILRVEDCNDGNTNCNAFNNISYFGFEEEVYSLGGECVSATELDLTIDDPFIVDTNKIQDVVEYGADTYDDKCFIIKRDPSATQNAEQSDPFNLGQNWYNESYTNKEILSRYTDFLFGGLGLYSLYNDYTLFLYSGTNASGTLTPNQTPAYQYYPAVAGTGVPLNNLQYEVNCTIDTGNERFYPDFEGAYQFCVGISIDEIGSPPIGIIAVIQLCVEHYDSGGSLIQRYDSDPRSYLTGTPEQFEEWVSPFISMDAGDFAVFTVAYAQATNPATGQALINLGGGATDQYFQCCASRVAVQDQIATTGAERTVAITSIEYPIDFETMQSFLADTTQRIRIKGLNIDRVGYIKSLEYNFVTGNSKLQILTKG